MPVQQSESHNRAQLNFLYFCAVGLCLSVGAWLVNVDVASRYFLGTGLIPLPESLPMYRQISALAVDRSTITPALFIALFGLPLYASRRRAMPYPRNFFFLCTYAGLAGTLIGVMISFWSEGGSITPIEQAKQLFSRLTVGLPTAMVSTLAGIFVPTMAHYLARWYCVAFQVKFRQSAPLTSLSRAIQAATAAFTSLIDSIHQFQRGCADGANTTERFVARTSALNQSLTVVTRNIDTIDSKIAKVVAGLTALLNQTERSVNATLQSVAAMTALTGEIQLDRKLVETLAAKIQSMHAENAAQNAALLKRLDDLPNAIAKEMASSLKPLETAMTTSQQQLRRRLVAALSDDSSEMPEFTLIEKDSNNASRNGHAVSQH